MLDNADYTTTAQHNSATKIMVGEGGFEPTTSRTQNARSDLAELHPDMMDYSIVVNMRKCDVISFA